MVIMADTITPSSSSWATSLMKPAPDEEITSAWGRSIADNTGYLFHRQRSSPQLILTGHAEVGSETIDTNGHFWRIKTPDIPFFRDTTSGTLFWWAVAFNSDGGDTGETVNWSLDIIYPADGNSGIATTIRANGTAGSLGTVLRGSLSAANWSSGWHIARWLPTFDGTQGNGKVRYLDFTGVFKFD